MKNIKLILTAILNRFMYSGLRFKCNVCGKNLRHFISLYDIDGGRFVSDLKINGVIYKAHDYELLEIKNYLCPFCGAQDKVRLIHQYIENKLHNDIPNIRNILHFAPENVHTEHYFQSQSNKPNYVKVDKFRFDIDVKLDIEHLPFLAESIDLIICSHVLEHVLNVNKSLRELNRVMVKGGIAILIVPIMLTLGKTHENLDNIPLEARVSEFGQEDHLRVYSKKGFINEILEANLKITEYQPCQNQNSTKTGLSSSATIYLCQKK
jgi:SAM-dependent methyltransferase